MDEQTRQFELAKIKRTLRELQLEHLQAAATDPVVASRIQADIVFCKKLQKKLEGEDPHRKKTPN